MRFRNHVSTLFFVLFFAAAQIIALPPDAIPGWQEDIEQVRKSLLEVHPQPFRHVEPEKLEGAFQDLLERLPRLEPYEAAMDLAEVVALLGDGHTRITLPLAQEAGFVAGHSSTPPPLIEELRFEPLGIRVGDYAEGMLVERAQSQHGDLLGGRIAAIGGIPIDEARRRLRSVIRHDNDRQFVDLLPMFLVVPEVLASRGLTPSPDRATFDLILSDGTARQVVLRRQRDDQPWESALFTVSEGSLGFRFLTKGLAPRRGAFARDYWYEVAPDGRTLYLQYNQAEDSEEESLLDFSHRLRSDLSAREISRIVVDLRWNWGGNNSASRPLLHALISAEAAESPGGLFVLIGRSTFSAAMMFATDLERHLRPVFVGESTGSSPNHAGDARKVRLKHTGLTLRVSTLWWQYGGPRDTRDAIEAHLEFEPSWKALVEGRDPALEVVMGRDSLPDLQGLWRGRMTPPAQDFGLELHLSEVDGSLHGWLTAERLGERLTIREGRRQGERFWFRVSREDGDLEFEGVVLKNALAGRVIYDGFRSEAFAFGMRRATRGVIRAEESTENPE